jgi:tyrosine-protein kinase Etk/Wzc
MSHNTKNNLNSSSKAESGIDVRQLLRKTLKYWYLFVLIPALTLTAAWIYMQYEVPIYEVKSTVLIKDEKNKQGVTASDIIAKEFGLEANKKMLIDESKIMTSYTVIEKVVKDLKLNSSISIKGALKNTEIYEPNMPIQVDSFVLNDTVKSFKAALEITNDNSYALTLPNGITQNGIFGQMLMNNYGQFLIKKGNNPAFALEKSFLLVCQSTEKTAREIIKTIDIVLPKKESNLIEPTIKATMPEKAKDILEKMVTVYNELSLNDKKQVSQTTLNFIAKRIQALTTDLTNVEQNVESYKTREGITSDVTSDIGYFFNKLGEYDSELVKLEVQNSLLLSIESILTRRDPFFDLLPTNLELKSSSLQSQIGDYNKLVLERNRLSKVAGENSPNLRNLTTEIGNIKRAIIDNIGRVKQENTLLLAQTKAKNNQFIGKLGKTPRNERELTDIKRQQNIKEGIYLFLLQKQEETAISMIGTVPDARIVDRPIIGDKPVSKSKIMVYLVALAIGIFLSFATLILSDLMIRTIQSEADVTTKTSMPILGKILHSKTPDHWIVQNGSQSMATEMFRAMRSNLQFMLPKNNPLFKGQALLLTSLMPEEGKRFMAINLGMSLAIADKRTVIVSLDLRNPKLSFSFPTLKNAKGITEYLTSEIYPHEIIHPTGKHRDLFYINGGSIPFNPAELIMSPKLAQLFAYLKENFDYVIINTPPIGLVSDALSLASYADMTVFMVRIGLTKKSSIKQLEAFNDNQKFPNPTVVLNGVKERTNQKGHGYYSNDILVNKRFDDNTNRFSPTTWLKEHLGV